eukprot:296584-Prorocentrum_minimum.AAC.2
MSGQKRYGRSFAQVSIIERVEGIYLPWRPQDSDQGRGLPARVARRRQLSNSRAYNTDVAVLSFRRVIEGGRQLSHARVYDTARRKGCDLRDQRAHPRLFALI